MCSTHRTMLSALPAFELHMHQHVHEENNVLFPRVRARAAA
jgi:regulator of cell morphogenesis and NO signaling